MKTLHMAQIALAAAFISICAWISIPSVVPFTLQSFAIFFILLLLGGKKGTMAVALYLLLGAVGLPVFAGFKGGVSALFGITGGYIWGFLLMALLYWVTEKYSCFSVLRLGIGLILLYAFGSAWFMLLYTQSKGAISIMAVLSLTVFPFVIPDLLKLFLAWMVSKRVQKALNRYL